MQHDCDGVDNDKEDKDYDVDDHNLLLVILDFCQYTSLARLVVVAKNRRIIIPCIAVCTVDARSDLQPDNNSRYYIILEKNSQTRCKAGRCHPLRKQHPNCYTK